MQATREILSFSKKNTHVYITRNNIDLSTDVDLIQFIDEEKEKYVALKSEKRKKEFLTVRILTNHFFPDKEIKYHKNGAPFLTDHSYRISISHTSSFVGIAISTDDRVGLDLEEIQEKIIRLAPKFMHQKEIESIISANLALEYTYYWCGKEALYKWSGKDGLSFQNELPIYNKYGNWVGKSTRISEDEISLEMIQLENHIVCFTY